MYCLTEDVAYFEQQEAETTDNMAFPRIINIAGVQIAVSDQDYNYYWNRRNAGEESNSFITACRRILGLGSSCHELDISFIKGHIWGDNKENCIQKILDSGLIEYEKKWISNQKDSKLKVTAYTAQREEQLKSGLDDELENELILQ